MASLPTPLPLDQGSTPSSRASRFPVIVVGGSAGALSDLEMIASTLPRSAAVMCLQHAGREEHESLRRLLANASGREIKVASDGNVLSPGCVYVVPSEISLTIEGETLRVGPLRCDHANFPIDALFRAVAIAFGARTTAVLLSGCGSDGALGLRAVREQGGLTIVQDPESALQPGMPAHALGAGYADKALTSRQIAQELAVEARQIEDVVLLDEDSARRLGDLISPLGIDLSSYKQAVVERRLHRRMNLCQVSGLERYLGILEVTPAELEALARDLLINVTGFFRDACVFDSLKASVFRSLVNGRDKDVPIRIWVPACSTGEEAVSLVIGLLECAPDANIQVFATDIDTHSLKTARAAFYPASAMQALGSDRLMRYFVRTEQSYKLVRRVRECIVYARHDTTRDPPYSGLDLLSCRNLLIYLRPEVQRKILANFYYAIKPGGFLLLGSSESVDDASDLFSVVNARARLFTRRKAHTQSVFEFAGDSDESSSSAARGSVRAPRLGSVESEQILRRDAVRIAAKASKDELKAIRQEQACLAAESAAVRQELRSAQSRLYELQGELGALLTTTAGLFVLVDHEQRILRTSRAVAARFGSNVTRQGTPLLRLSSMLGAPMLAVWVGEALANSCQRSGQFTGAQGTYRVSIAPFACSAGPGAAWIELIAQDCDTGVQKSVVELSP